MFRTLARDRETDDVEDKPREGCPRRVCIRRNPLSHKRRLAIIFYDANIFSLGHPTSVMFWWEISHHGITHLWNWCKNEFQHIRNYVGRACWTLTIPYLPGEIGALSKIQRRHTNPSESSNGWQRLFPISSPQIWEGYLRTSTCHFEWSARNAAPYCV